MLTQPTIDIVKAVTPVVVENAVDEKLRTAGVPDTAINYECFGPL